MNQQSRWEEQNSMKGLVNAVHVHVGFQVFEYPASPELVRKLQIYRLLWQYFLTGIRYRNVSTYNIEFGTIEPNLALFSMLSNATGDFSLSTRIHSPAHPRTSSDFTSPLSRTFRPRYCSALILCIKVPNPSAFSVLLLRNAVACP
jgi:hypothetical protein